MEDAPLTSSPETLSAWPAKPTLVTLPAACLLLLYFFFQLVHRRRPPPANWPLLGMFPSFISNMHRIFDWGTEVLRPNGCNLEFKGPWFLGMDFLLVADPANTNHILNLSHSNYPKGDEYLQIFDVLGGGIFNSTGDQWRYQRRKAHAFMSSGDFRSSVAGRSKDKVENGLLPLMTHFACKGDAVDLQDVLLRFTFDLTCTSILGVDPGCLSVDFPIVPFSTAVEEVEEVVFFRHTVPEFWWKLLRRLRTGPEKRIAEAKTVIDRYMADHISKMREECPRGDKDPSLLSSFLSDYKGVDVDEILRDVGLSFLVAGRDTTAAGLTWFFYMITQNPDVEAKILEELSWVSPAKEREGVVVFDSDELGALVYLHAAMYETLRLFPPVPLNHKAAVAEDVLPSGHRVSAGKRIIISPHAMARMPEVWGKDCDQFRPERWVSEDGKLRYEPSYKFLAFSSGPRSCLGRDTSLTQMKVAAAAIVYNFEVELVNGHVVHPKISLILQVEHGLMVRIRRRRRGGAVGGGGLAA